jgi:hypothetical protein
MSFKYISIGLLDFWPMPNAGDGDVGPATRSTSRNARAKSSLISLRTFCACK